jgi:hypothetical protein
MSCIVAKTAKDIMHPRVSLQAKEKGQSTAFGMNTNSRRGSK